METNESIVLGGGCFWCLEAIFQKIDGVTKVISGYAGGTSVNPSYQQVCTGSTGHAEVIKVEFDNTKISLEKILKVYFLAHDPTTRNRQGNDVGTQYRSTILYTDEPQKKVIEKVIEDVQKESPDSIVTEVKPLENFYEAEDYHKDYFKNNPNSSYCRFVIQPKLDKVLKEV
jgi:peptide-methionine (S)-S-oxide reductase